MSEPRFKIGDFVVVRAQRWAAALGQVSEVRILDEKPRPIVGQIVEMIEQTCPGGVQRKYAVKFCTPGGMDVEAQCRLEIELDHAPPMPE